MAVDPLAIYIAPIVATLVILKLIGSRLPCRRRLNLPPGPKPWPIIGNLNIMGPLPHRSIHQLSRSYGPMMQLFFGSLPVVVASSAAMAREILKTHDLKFASRPKTAAGKYTAYNNGDITWAPYGPLWRQARKLCAVELFSPRSLDSLEYVRVEEIRSLLSGLFRIAGKPLELKSHLSSLSLNVISRMVLGKKYGKESDEFRRMIDELFFLAGAMNIGDYIPLLENLDLQRYVRRMKKLHVKFDAFLDRILDEHVEQRRRKGNEFVTRDMIDVLLQFVDGHDDRGVKLSRDNVKAYALDLLAGGTESSTVTVEWAISEMMKHPEIFEKAVEELDRVIGRDRWVEEKDAAALPYIESITKETMRLHTVAPLLVPRTAREDCVVAGYDIPAGTTVLVSVWSISRDPNIWDSPEKFRPERFLEKGFIDVKGNNFELLPFGSGRRMCPGYSLGMRIIQASLANLVHGFRWRLPDGVSAKDLGMEEVFGLSMPRRVPLRAVVEPRLPAHLYRM